MTQPPTIVPTIARGDSLTDQAEAVLRQALMSGGFVPGQTLTIRALSAMLGVSVTPAKDAMTRLIAERVMEWGERRTARVPILTSQSIDEIYHHPHGARRHRGGCGRAEHGRPRHRRIAEDPGQLVRAFAKHDYRNVLLSNWDFHFAIYRRGDLPILLSMIEGLWLRMGPSLNLLYSNFSKGDWAERAGVGFHDEIIAALRKRDPEAVRRQIVADLATGRDRLHAAVLARVA